MLCKLLCKQIIRDYKNLKKEIAKDFIETIKAFKKRYPYIKSITFRSKNFPFRSMGTVIMDDKFEVEVLENDINLKD